MGSNIVKIVAMGVLAVTLATGCEESIDAGGLTEAAPGWSETSDNFVGEWASTVAWNTSGAGDWFSR